MSTEIDKLIIELLKKELSNEKEFEFAVELYKKYKMYGVKGIRQFIIEYLKNLGVDLTSLE